MATTEIRDHDCNLPTIGSTLYLVTSKYGEESLHMTLTVAQDRLIQLGKDSAAYRSKEVQDSLKITPMELQA